MPAEGYKTKKIGKMVFTSRDRKPDAELLPVYRDQSGDEDWIKTQHWDLTTDPEEFRIMLQHWGMTMEQFLELPAAQAMPAGLRKALGIKVQLSVEKKEE